MDKDKLADFFEKMLPYLDWQLADTVDDLRNRLTEITRLCTEFGSEVRGK